MLGEVKQYGPDTTIVYRGAAETDLFLLEKGTVEVLRDGLPAIRLEAGQLVGEPVSAATLAEALALPAWCQGWPLAAPVEVLLTTGGDTRLAVDPETGLNCYGCSPRPRPDAITFASTTATSISDGAFAAVEGLRRRLIG